MDCTRYASAGRRDLLRGFAGRNPKAEYRNPKQIQSTKPKIQNKYSNCRCFGHSDFGIVSDSDIRISDFLGEAPYCGRALTLPMGLTRNSIAF